MKKLKLGIVGLGRMGLVHAQTIINDLSEAQLEAICAKGDLSSLEKQLGVKKVYQDYQKMVLEADLDGVVIVSPTPLHPEQIQFALENNLHVFCEKPLGINTEAALKIYQEALKYPHLVLQIGFMRRYDASYLEAKRKLDLLTKKGGRAILFEALSEDSEKDIEKMFAFGPSSGGQFIDVSGHDLDLMVWFANSYPKRVLALGKAYKYPQFASWNDGDIVSGIIEFHNGAMGFVVASRNGPQGYQNTMRITTSSGKILVNAIDAATNVSEINEKGFNFQYHPDFISRFQNAYRAELSAFVNNIKTQNTSQNNILDALINIVAIRALQDSFEQKKEIIIKYPEVIKIK